jgi:hypothetical protein
MTSNLYHIQRRLYLARKRMFAMRYRQLKAMPKAPREAVEIALYFAIQARDQAQRYP